MTTDKKKLKIFKCPNCINNNFNNSNLEKKNKNLLFCKKCKVYYPTYYGSPVLLVEQEDHFNFRKATLKSKYRIFDYEN